MVFSASLNLLVNFAIQYFISKNDGIEAVGLYNTAFTFLNSYVGILFTAMSIDYYPKISAQVSNVFISQDLIRKQIIIGMLLIFPLLIFVQFYSNFFVKMLFTKDFLKASPMISFGMFGMFF
jgi:O-antigen/teichoic acid export membrane protein